MFPPPVASTSSSTPAKAEKYRWLWSLRLRHLSIVTVSLPLGAFLYCIAAAFYFNFKGATYTHCDVFNFAPSISSSIGFKPQKYIWQCCIGLHSSPRFIFATVTAKHFSTRVSRSRLKLVTIAWICQCVENLALLLLTFVTSSDNFLVHKIGFSAFCGFAFLHQMLMVFLQSSHSGYIAQNSRERQSARWKWFFFKWTCAGIPLMVYLYWRHNEYCEPIVYSLFCIAEYTIVLCNMGFHLTAYYDFYACDLGVIPQFPYYDYGEGADGYRKLDEEEQPSRTLIAIHVMSIELLPDSIRRVLADLEAEAIANGEGQKRQRQRDFYKKIFGLAPSKSDKAKSGDEQKEDLEPPTKKTKNGQAEVPQKEDKSPKEVTANTAAIGDALQTISLSSPFGAKSSSSDALFKSMVKNSMTARTLLDFCDDDSESRRKHFENNPASLEAVSNLCNFLARDDVLRSLDHKRVLADVAKLVIVPTLLRSLDGEEKSEQHLKIHDSLFRLLGTGNEDKESQSAVAESVIQELVKPLLVSAKNAYFTVNYFKLLSAAVDSASSKETVLLELAEAFFAQDTSFTEEAQLTLTETFLSASSYLLKDDAVLRGLAKCLAVCSPNLWGSAKFGKVLFSALKKSPPELSRDTQESFAAAVANCSSFLKAATARELASRRVK